MRGRDFHPERSYLYGVITFILFYRGLLFDFFLTLITKELDCISCSVDVGSTDIFVTNATIVSMRIGNQNFRLLSSHSNCPFPSAPLVARPYPSALFDAQFIHISYTKKTGERREGCVGRGGDG